MGNYDKKTTTVQLGSKDRRHLKTIMDFYEFAYQVHAIRRALESLAAAIEIEMAKQKENDGD